MTDRAGPPTALPLAAIGDVGHADGDNRRHFGAPVPFEQIDAKSLLERRGDRLAQLFRADDRVAQMRELFGLALPHVRRCESRRAVDERRA